MTRIAVLGIVLVGLLAGTAQGESVHPVDELPLNRPAEASLVASVEPVAERYWAIQGVTLPPGVEVFVASYSQLGGIAAAELGGTRIWMNGFLLHPRTVENRAGFCRTYIHERGHTAGLEDDDGYPIMEYGPRGNFTPHICWEWARPL